MGQKVNPRVYRRGSKHGGGFHERAQQSYTERGLNERQQQRVGPQASLSELGELRGYVIQILRRYGCEVNELKIRSQGGEYRVYGSYRELNVREEGEVVQRVKAHRSMKQEVKATRDYKRPGGQASRLARALGRVSRLFSHTYGRRVRFHRVNLRDRVPQGMYTRRVQQLRTWNSKVTSREGVAARVALTGVYPCAPLVAQVVRREFATTLKHRQTLLRRKSLLEWHADMGGRKRPGHRGGYLGYRLEVKGTLDGGLRTMRSLMTKGSVPASSMDARLSYAHVEARTVVGTIGIQVTYCYGRGVAYEPC